MKKLWLVLLSLGLLMAFSASAFAVDVQFSGSYFAAGMYLDQTNLAKSGTTGNQSQDTAFYYQRMIIQTDFIVSPGLKLVTRFDALERIWGGARSNPYADGANTNASYSIATRADSENIALNLMYVEYASPIGLWQVGYIHDNSWGLQNGFGQSDANGHTTGGIGYYLPIGQFVFGGIIYKEQSNKLSAVNPTQTSTDVDWDRYILIGLYNFKDGDAGVLVGYDRNAANNPYGLLVNVFYVQPKFTVKVGPVKVQGMLYYGWGSEAQTSPYYFSGTGIPTLGIPSIFPSPQSTLGVGGPNISMQQIMGDLDVNVDLGFFYVGGQFAYMSGPGNDPYNVKGGWYGGGLDWNPCLIMFNNDLTYWAGGINSPGGYNMSNPGTGTGIGMTNAWFFQGDGGIRPLPKLDIRGAVSYAMADTVPNGYASDKSYGWELDVTGTYKITNNLSYMLGVGYWWPGDYYKGNTGNPSGPGYNANVSIRDDYMLINKLTLTF
jgi:hypothetical protein